MPSSILEFCTFTSAAAPLTVAIAAMASLAPFCAICGSGQLQCWAKALGVLSDVSQHRHWLRRQRALPSLVALGVTGLLRGPLRWTGASVAVAALVPPRLPGKTRWTSHCHRRAATPANVGKITATGVEEFSAAVAGTSAVNAVPAASAGNQAAANRMLEGRHSARELQALGLLAEIWRYCAGHSCVEPAAVTQSNTLPEEVLWDRTLGVLRCAEQHGPVTVAAPSSPSSPRLETVGAKVVKEAESSLAAGPATVAACVARSSGQWAGTAGKSALPNPDFGWVWRKVQKWQHQCVQCRGISLESCEDHGLCVYTADGIVRLLLGEVLRPTDLRKRSSEEALSEILALPESLQLGLPAQCCHHTLVNVQCKHHQFVVECGFDHDNQMDERREEKDEKDLKGAEAMEGVRIAASSRSQDGCNRRGRLRVFQSWSGYFNLGWWMGLEKPLQLHRKHAKFADPRFQEFRDLQLEAGSLSHKDGLQLLRFLFEKGGPVWRIERHELADRTLSDRMAATATKRPLPQAGKVAQPSWPAALASLVTVAAGQALPDGAALRAALLELVDGGQQERIPQVLDDLSKSGVTLGDACGHSLTGTLGVAEQAGDWCRALWLLNLLERHAARIDGGFYAAVVGACERGGQLPLAKQLVEDAGRHGLDLDMLTHSAVVAACHRGGDFREKLADVYGEAYRWTHAMIKNPELRKVTEEMLSKHNAEGDES